jgi:hypothetical protein
MEDESPIAPATDDKKQASVIDDASPALPSEQESIRLLSAEELKLVGGGANASATVRETVRH